MYQRPKKKKDLCCVASKTAPLSTECFVHYIVKERTQKLCGNLYDASALGCRYQFTIHSIRLRGFRSFRYEMNEKAAAQRWTGTGSIPTSPIYPVLEKNVYYNNVEFVSVQLIVLSGK